MQCAITFEWGDGEYKFCLKLKQLEELQEKTGAGPEELWSRLVTLPEDMGGLRGALQSGLTKPRAIDLHHVHRLGLIGGGKKDEEALKLTRRYVDERPRADSYGSARLILGAVIFGCPADLKKKLSDSPNGNLSEALRGATTEKMGTDSHSPPSTAAEP